MHYSFALLAHNTKCLLGNLKIETVAAVGQSMGGMQAARFALMYPTTTWKLVLENPIALEDYQLKAPFKTTEALYKEILAYTETDIRAYQKAYYPHWKRKIRDVRPGAIPLDVKPGISTPGLGLRVDLSNGIHTAGAIRVSSHRNADLTRDRPTRQNHTRSRRFTVGSVRDDGPVSAVGQTHDRRASICNVSRTRGLSAYTAPRT
jgi:pimeloyl-ACP methyl ester carboxylesterase